MIDRLKKQTNAFLKEYVGPCPICGYQLHAPTGKKCPECGSFLEVQLSAPFRFTPWHAMVTALAISIGGILDRLALSMIGVLNSNTYKMPWLLIGFTFIPLLLLFGIFWLNWKQKRRVNSKKRWKRIVWYVVALLIPILVVAGQLWGLVEIIIRA